LLRLTLTRNDFNNIAQARLLLSEGGLLEGISPRPRRRRARSGILRASLPHLFRAVRLSLLAEILLRQGRASEAVELAREALALDRTTACLFALRQEAISVLLAEALHASGDIDAARAAIRESRNVLLAGSAKSRTASGAELATLTGGAVTWSARPASSGSASHRADIGGQPQALALPGARATWFTRRATW